MVRMGLEGGGGRIGGRRTYDVAGASSGDISLASFRSAADSARVVGLTLFSLCWPVCLTA